MTQSPAIKALARRIDPVCWRSYSGKSRDFKRGMEVRRVASLRKAHAEAAEVEGKIADECACETIPFITDQAVRNRAYKIDPACWTSYSGDARIRAQETSLAEARRQLILEWASGQYHAERTPPEGGSGVPASADEREQGCTAARYSVSDIDRMRKALNRNPKNRLGGYPYDGSKPHRQLQYIEELLRTHMLNGTSPADLEKEADDEWAAIRARQALRERDRHNNAQVVAELSAGTPHVLAVGLTHELPLDVHTRVALRSRIEDAIKSVIMKFKR